MALVGHLVANAPIEHLQDALKLEGDGKVSLWEVRLKTSPVTIYRFWNGPTRTWQGVTYEGLACQLSGDSREEGRSSRPTLTVQNPEKILGTFAADGYFDLAELIRKRVLQQHFLADVNLFEQRIWISARAATVGRGVLQLDLRSPTDMPPWKTPRRVYAPPTHPFVTL